MFTKGQKVWCNIRGWGVVQAIVQRCDSFKDGAVYIQFDGLSGPLACYLNGKYSHKQNQCVFPGKPIISGYAPPPFEGKLKKGEMVLIKSRGAPEHTWYTIKVERETEGYVISETESRFDKSNYLLYRIDKEPVY